MLLLYQQEYGFGYCFLQLMRSIFRLGFWPKTPMLVPFLEFCSDWLAIHKMILLFMHISIISDFILCVMMPPHIKTIFQRHIYSRSDDTLGNRRWSRRLNANIKYMKMARFLPTFSWMSSLTPGIPLKSQLRAKVREFKCQIGYMKIARSSPDFSCVSSLTQAAPLIHSV